MGVLFDYFAAGSDGAAAAVLDRVGGPGSRDVLVQDADAQPGPGGRAPMPTVVTDESLPVHDTVELKGIDPVVVLGTVGSLLAGVPFDDLLEDPRHGEVLAERDEGALMVCTVSDTLAAALADADPATLARVAVPWSQTDELRGYSTPADLTQVLELLAALARRARDGGLRLYCRICV
jgi:hypothetical protein